MTSTESFYPGTDYGLDPNYGMDIDAGEYGNFTGYRMNVSDIGYSTDPTTANQMQKVSEKLSTGAKVVEVQGLGIMGGGGAMSHLDKIPKQQWDEIRRLKELSGAELTFHGPLVEATGVSRQGWDETQRQDAERQMFEAIKRGQVMDPKGNLVVTFHASNGLPEPETTVIDDETGKPKTTQMYFVDERTGQFQTAGPPQKDWFKKDPETSIKEVMNKQNEDSWFRELQHVNFNAFGGIRDLKHSSASIDLETGKAALDSKALENNLKLYKEYTNEPEKIKNFMNKLKPEEQVKFKETMTELTHADVYLRDAYQGFKTLFNQAYDVAIKDKSGKDYKLLNNYRKELLPIVKEIEEDPSKLPQFGDEIMKGVTVLRQIKPPQRFTPLRDFAIDKASKTFGNVAFDSYKKFKNHSPIISIENPPVGMGLSRGQDLKDLVKESRKQFVKKAMKPKSEDGLGMSKSAAEKQAEKLLGVTWDVGHINMIRKHGYDEKELLKQTEKVAPYIKHVHLSDNFGMEHTELPMGMGNVPTKKHMELIEKYNNQAKKLKKIVETGDWFSRQGGLGMTQTPVIPTLTAMGSPVYAMHMSPYWNQVAATSAGYFAGIGATNPNIHHSIYGAGYSNLPVEMGGQLAGTNRMGGAPME